MAGVFPVVSGTNLGACGGRPEARDIAGAFREGYSSCYAPRDARIACSSRESAALNACRVLLLVATSPKDPSQPQIISRCSSLAAQGRCLPEPVPDLKCHEVSPKYILLPLHLQAQELCDPPVSNAVSEGSLGQGAQGPGLSGVSLAPVGHWRFRKLCTSDGEQVKVVAISSWRSQGAVQPGPRNSLL